MRVSLDTRNPIEQQPVSSVSPRLKKGAQEFEAQMMKELLQPMTGQDALTGEEADGDRVASTTSTLGEFASEALGQAISRNGGFGIAQRIVHELSRSGHAPADGRKSVVAGRISS